MHDAEGEDQPFAHAHSPTLSPPPTSPPSPPSPPTQRPIGLPPLPIESPKYLKNRPSPLPLNNSPTYSPLPRQSPNPFHSPIYHSSQSPNSPQPPTFHATIPSSPNQSVTPPLIGTPPSSQPSHPSPMPHPPSHVIMMPIQQPHLHHMTPQPSTHCQYAPFPHSHPPPQNILLDPRSTRTWSTGLFDCFSDVKNCILTLCCPCVTFGQVSEILTEGHIRCWESTFIYTGLFCFSTIFSFSNRTKMRKKFSLRGDLCSDCSTSMFCQCFVLCQMYRQLDRMGYKVALGWEANKEVERQRTMQAALQVPPLVDQRMLR